MQVTALELYIYTDLFMSKYDVAILKNWLKTKYDWLKKVVEIFNTSQNVVLIII